MMRDYFFPFSWTLLNVLLFVLVDLSAPLLLPVFLWRRKKKTRSPIGLGAGRRALDGQSEEDRGVPWSLEPNCKNSRVHDSTPSDRGENASANSSSRLCACWQLLALDVCFTHARAWTLASMLNTCAWQLSDFDERWHSIVQFLALLHCPRREGGSVHLRFRAS